MSEPVGIIGLGRIGLAAAKAYLQDGRKVYACDVNPQAINAVKAEGGIDLKTPKEVAMHAKVILVLVLNDQQATEVIIGNEGLLKSADSDSTIICMSTITQKSLQTLSVAALKSRVGFIDCPFTGGPARVSTRNLTLIAAGDTNVLERVRPVLETLGRITYAGSEPGKGQAIKHCNQLFVGITHAATMEVITLARKMGLDPSQVTAVVGSGIAASDYFRLLSESVLKKTASPGRLGQMCKDMAIVKNTLSDLRLHAGVALAASSYFESALQAGMAEMEGADLIEVVERAANR